MLISVSYAIKLDHSLKIIVDLGHCLKTVFFKNEAWGENVTVILRQVESVAGI